MEELKQEIAELKARIAELEEENAAYERWLIKATALYAELVEETEAERTKA